PAHLGPQRLEFGGLRRIEAVLQDLHRADAALARLPGGITILILLVARVVSNGVAGLISFFHHAKRGGDAGADGVEGVEQVARTAWPAIAHGAERGLVGAEPLHVLVAHGAHRSHIERAGHRHVAGPADARRLAGLERDLVLRDAGGRPEPHLEDAPRI